MATQLPAGSGLEGSGPFVVTDGAPQYAADIVSALTGSGAQAALMSDGNMQSASTILVTEGLSDLAVTERHWRVLEVCKRLYEARADLVLLEIGGTGHAGRMSGLAGLARTLRQEWPERKISCWTLKGVEQQGDYASTILRALKGNVEDAELYGDTARGSRIGPAPKIERVPPTESNVWFISGGARGVTAACVTELANRQPGSTFILAGRSAITEWPANIPLTDDMKKLRASLITVARSRGEKPTLPEIDSQARAALAGQEIRTTLSVIQAAGSRPVYVQLDVADRAQTHHALSELVTQFGPVSGLVHGAGVLSDNLALKKSQSEVERVFGPKVEGLVNILDTIDISALNHIGLFSSASAVFGNIGQSDYAMANAWLNTVAWDLSEKLPSAIVKSFCWGPWDGGMVDATLSAHFATRGISLIGLEDGANIFADQILQGEKKAVELLIGDEWAG